MTKHHIYPPLWLIPLFYSLLSFVYYITLTSVIFSVHHFTIFPTQFYHCIYIFRCKNRKGNKFDYHSKNTQRILDTEYEGSRYFLAPNINLKSIKLKQMNYIFKGGAGAIILFLYVKNWKYTLLVNIMLWEMPGT